MNKTLEKIVNYPRIKLDNALIIHIIRERLSDQMSKDYSVKEINTRVQNLIMDKDRTKETSSYTERIAEDMLEAVRYYFKPQVKTLKRAYTKKLFEPYKNEKWIYRTVHKGIAKATPVRVNNKTLHTMLSFAAGLTIGRIHYSNTKNIIDGSGISKKFMTNGLLAGELVSNYTSTLQNQLFIEIACGIYSLFSNDTISEDTKTQIVNGIHFARYTWSAIGFLANNFFEKYIPNYLMYMTPTSAPVMIGSKILSMKEKYESTTALRRKLELEQIKELSVNIKDSGSKYVRI
ncbi:MAG: hypothetical protein ACP5NV_01825 [Candidatus Woesearchaeota archaeon]